MFWLLLRPITDIYLFINMALGQKEKRVPNIFFPPKFTCGSLTFSLSLYLLNLLCFMNDRRLMAEIQKITNGGRILKFSKVYYHLLHCILS